MTKFEYYIQSFQQIVNSQGLIAYLVDSSSTILAVSNNFCSEFNLARPQDIAGINYARLLPEETGFFSLYAAELMQNDSLVCINQQQHVFLQIINQENFSKLYIVHKYPVIIDHNVVAIYTYMRPYGFPRIPDITFLTFGIDLYAKPLSSCFSLTAKQLLILFFLIRNHSYTEIATWMGAFGYPLSTSRVNEHITNLKVIFGVSSREELISKALVSGYYSELPVGLLAEGSYLIDDYLFDLKVVNAPVAANSLTFLEPHTLQENSIIWDSTIPVLAPELVQAIQVAEPFYSQTDDGVGFIDLNGQLAAHTRSLELFDVIADHEFLSAIIKDNPELPLGKYLRVVELTESKRLYLVYRYLLLDPGNAACGYLILIRPYIMPSIPRIMEALFKVIKLPNETINEKILFTHKQLVVLYFYIRNYSSQKISEVLTRLGLKMSIYRVNEHLAEIKKKLNVKHKSHLMDRALLVSYHLIPAELLKPGFFSIEQTLIDKWIC